MVPLRNSRWFLSCDGSLTVDRAGYGGLLRDDNVEAIFAYIGMVIASNILLVELFGLRRGLSLAI